MPKPHEPVISRTREDFGWPRVVPVRERPALPPLNTGIRKFCPKPDKADLCKQDDYQEYDARLDSCKPAKFEKPDDNPLMSRKKFMLLDEAITCKPIADRTKLKSTIQNDYPSDKLNYKEIKNRLQVPKDEAAVKECLTNRSFYDPFPFAKLNDKPPLIG